MLRTSILPALVLSLGASLSTGSTHVSSGSIYSSQEDSTDRFAMLYEELSSKQKALVDDWIARYAELRSEDIEPHVYNEFPLSVKTTFAAVTHALTQTPLTDENGDPLEGAGGEPLTALDLVAKLDTVRGKVKGARGDEQFRVYVQLIPDAVALLEASAEFARGHDNTVYHKGYPQNYRSGDGVPSIQFSIALNNILCDIDVDYRSSKIPAAIVNGHLSSSNSDVRAGDNFRRHNEVWAGLTNWWAGWEGLGDWFSALYGVRGLDIPEETAEGDGDAAEAVRDFLQSWLVDDRPDVAMAYFSEDIYKCFQDRDEEVGEGASVEQRMYRKMSETVRVVGNPRNLSQVAQGVQLTSLELEAVPGNHAHFVLYPVPAERVIEFECGFQNMSIPRAQRAQFRRSGEHVLATFFLQSGDMRGVTASLLWARESDGWKMISFELEPAVGLVPDLHALPPVPRARGGSEIETDPELAAASDAFITSWFVDNDYDTALGYVSDQSYRCLDVFGDADEASTLEPRERFRAVLAAVSEFVGLDEGDALADAIAGVEPWSPMLVDVTPSGSAATLIAIPDSEADAHRCLDASTGTESTRRQVEPVYGNFFGSTFRVNLAGGEHPATFLFLWSRDEGAWKVVAFEAVAD